MEQKYLDAANNVLSQIELIQGSGPAAEGEERAALIMILATVIKTIKEV